MVLVALVVQYWAGLWCPLDLVSEIVCNQSISTSMYVNLSMVLQEFHRNVMAKAEVIQVTGDAITSFSEIQCLTPRLVYLLYHLPSIKIIYVKIVKNF